MAYAIEKGEPISLAMPRIVIERIDTALAQLLDEKEPVEERIHNARKRFKESRAVVRLLRFSLGEQFAPENVWFRDAGRDLATLRDADAVLEAVDGLADFTDGFHERRVIRRLRRRLVRAQRRAKRVELDAAIANTAKQLPIARARIGLWPSLPDDFSAIGAGLKRTFRDGRRASKHALAAPSPEAFHDWRKRVKDHWYHVQVLRNLRPEYTKPYRDSMEQLSDALGDRHDLDILRETIGGLGDFGSEFDLRVLNTVIDRRVEDLSSTAATIGTQIYAEPSSAIYNRFEAYWTLWAPSASAVSS